MSEWELYNGRTIFGEEIPEYMSVQIAINHKKGSCDGSITLCVPYTRYSAARTVAMEIIWKLYYLRWNLTVDIKLRVPNY